MKVEKAYIHDQGGKGGYVLSLEILDVHVTTSTAPRIHSKNSFWMSIFDCDLAELAKLADGIYEAIEAT